MRRKEKEVRLRVSCLLICSLLAVSVLASNKHDSKGPGSLTHNSNGQRGGLKQNKRVSTDDLIERINEMDDLKDLVKYRIAGVASEIEKLERLKLSVNGAKNKSEKVAETANDGSLPSGITSAETKNAKVTSLAMESGSGVITGDQVTIDGIAGTQEILDQGRVTAFLDRQLSLLTQQKAILSKEIGDLEALIREKKELIEKEAQAARDSSEKEELEKRSLYEMHVLLHAHKTPDQEKLRFLEKMIEEEKLLRGEMDDWNKSLSDPNNMTAELLRLDEEKIVEGDNELDSLGLHFTEEKVEDQGNEHKGELILGKPTDLKVVVRGSTDHTKSTTESPQKSNNVVLNRPSASADAPIPQGTLIEPSRSADQLQSAPVGSIQNPVSNRGSSDFVERVQPIINKDVENQEQLSSIRENTTGKGDNAMGKGRSRRSETKQVESERVGGSSVVKSIEGRNEVQRKKGQLDESKASKQSSKQSQEIVPPHMSEVLAMDAVKVGSAHRNI
jgi:hypothetical protein